uniref:ORC1/DEAH AAA+ ATPase domain-containing protein n=1 Tax=Quercus lobata TaxID=97700 RepID=A0A7N2MBE5_QUELO
MVEFIARFLADSGIPPLILTRQEKAGSLYVCGCPGTGKSLSMEKVKQLLFHWANEARHQQPNVLTINCTSLAKTSDIFGKILGESQLRKKVNGVTSPLQHLQNLYSQKPQPSGMKMMLIIADELDYLITKDRAVLHDLFMLTTFPFSRCILIGIANAIDLADRFLPKLQSLNFLDNRLAVACTRPPILHQNIGYKYELRKPTVVTFRAYSKDQILKILHERLMFEELNCKFNHVQGNGRNYHFEKYSEVLLLHLLQFYFEH